MKKRILVIGPEGSGQRELICLLEGNQQLKFAPSLIYYDETILVPSSYLRGSGMKKHIIALQQNAYCVLMLLSSQRPFRIYSPNFAKAFRIPAIGLIVHHREVNPTLIMGCQEELAEAKVDFIYECNINSLGQCHDFLNKISVIKEGNQ